MKLRRGELLTDAALDAMDCARHAQEAVRRPKKKETPRPKMPEFSVIFRPKMIEFSGKSSFCSVAAGFRLPSFNGGIEAASAFALSHTGDCLGPWNPEHTRRFREFPDIQSIFAIHPSIQTSSRCPVVGFSTLHISLHLVYGIWQPFAPRP